MKKNDVSDFEEYLKVKNINLTPENDEPYLIRLRINDCTFAHIEIKSMSGVYNLSVLQIDEGNNRELVKWISGLKPSSHSP
jgi:hypothetical protein